MTKSKTDKNKKFTNKSDRIHSSSPEGTTSSLLCEAFVKQKSIISMADGENGKNANAELMR